MPSPRRSPGKWLLFAPLLLAMLFLAGEDSQGQPPGGGQGGGRRGMDPDAIWMKMTGGQDVDRINLNDNAPLKGMMTKMGTPIPADGVLTKDQFKANLQQRMQAGKGGQGGNFGPGTATAPGMGTAPPGGNPAAPAVIPAGPGGPNGWQGNGNGGPGQQFNPQDQGNYPQQDNAPRRPREPQEEELTRPEVYRFGKLPKGIPSFFEELDTDQDGMVGLYEWRRGGRAIDEFVKMDLNKDGYLTAQEWMEWSKRQLDPKAGDKPAASVRADRSADAGSSGGGRGPGGRGPGGGNRGGDDASATKGGGDSSGKGGDNGGQKGGKGKGKGGGKGGDKPNPFRDEK